MKWYEILWRKFKVKFFGKKYCNMFTRHGHELEKLYSRGKGLEHFVVFECKVCKEKFILDFFGLQKA